MAILNLQMLDGIWFISVEQPRNDRGCPDCHAFAVVKERPIVRLIDRRAFDKPVVILWRKYRLSCPNKTCGRKSWTQHDPRIASARTSLTARCARWVTREIRRGRTVSELAEELECNWSVVEDAMQVYGAELLARDHERVGDVEAIGLDETLFVRRGKRRMLNFCTTIADVRAGKVIDVIQTRDFVDVAAWIDAQPQSWKDKICFGTLDMSNVYRAIYREMLPGATRVCDPYHVIALVNRALDEVRRRVQNETLGHRGRKDDPLYRIRKLLLCAKERLDEVATERLEAQIALGDPGNEVSIAYLLKERMRDFYKALDTTEARELFETIVAEAGRRSMPAELQKLSRTLGKWREEITNWLEAKVTNGPTEALNNLIKRVKRAAFGFRSFESYRIRILLYAGKPNWRILDSISVP